MRVSFTTEEGCPELGIAFYWELVIEGVGDSTVTDLFIPELFFDLLFVRTGGITAHSPDLPKPLPLPQQSLKTLFGRWIELEYTTPLQVFGARLDLTFAESRAGGESPAAQFLPVAWVDPDTTGLQRFAQQVSSYLRDNRPVVAPVQLLNPDLSEAAPSAGYSDRHKRRLVRDTYGVSRKEMLAIRNVLTFLGQECDFDYDSPRLIEYVNNEVFYDQPHLNRMFKSRTGLSPLEYFAANSTLQENLMAISYNAPDNDLGTLAP